MEHMTAERTDTSPPEDGRHEVVQEASEVVDEDVETIYNVDASEGSLLEILSLLLIEDIVYFVKEVARTLPTFTPTLQAPHSLDERECRNEFTCVLGRLSASYRRSILSQSFYNYNRFALQPTFAPAKCSLCPQAHPVPRNIEEYNRVIALLKDGDIKCSPGKYFTPTLVLRHPPRPLNNFIKYLDYHAPDYVEYYAWHFKSDYVYRTYEDQKWHYLKRIALHSLGFHNVLHIRVYFPPEPHRMIALSRNWVIRLMTEGGYKYYGPYKEGDELGRLGPYREEDVLGWIDKMKMDLRKSPPSQCRRALGFELIKPGHELAGDGGIVVPSPTIISQRCPGDLRKEGDRQAIAKRTCPESWCA